MTVGVYGIFDSKTNECLYIGMSKNIELRWKNHLKKLRNKSHKRQDFFEWFHKNGADKNLLVFEILEECENDENILNSLEIKWFNSLSPKYYGKRPSLNETWVLSEETREKIKKTIIDKLPLDKNYLFRDLTCLFCDKIFHNKNKDRIFCSRKCQSEYTKYKSNKEYDYDYIYDLYWNQGLSRPELAKLLGVGRTKALTIMKRLGIPRRDSHDGLKRVCDEKRIEKMSEILKSLPKKICKYCNDEFSAMNIKRHEDVCLSYPRCPVCDVRLKKKTSKTCLNHR